MLTNAACVPSLGSQDRSLVPCSNILSKVLINLLAVVGILSPNHEENATTLGTGGQLASSNIFRIRRNYTP